MKRAPQPAIPAGEHAKRLAEDATLAIRGRSLSSAFLYPLLFLAALGVTPIFRRFPVTTAVIGLLILASSGAQAWLILKWKRYQGGLFAQWERALALTRLLAAASWGALACLSIVWFELGWTPFFILLVTLVISAAEVPALAPKFSLLKWVLILIIAPSLIATAFFVGGLKGTALGLFFIGFLAISMTLGQLQSKEYWHAAANHARMLAMLDAMPGTVSWVSAKLEYLGANARLAKLWKLRPRDFVGREIGFADQRREMREFAQELLAEPTRGSTSLAREVRFRTPEGDRSYYVTGETYNHGAEGVILGLDITNYKHAVEELQTRKAQARLSARLASLGEIVGNLADELESPLPMVNRKIAAIKGSLQLGSEDPTEPIAQLEDIDRVFYRISKLALLIARLSASGEADELKPVPVMDLFAEIELLCSERCTRRAVTLTTQNRSGKDYFPCQGSQLLEALLHLVNNALDAVAGKPRAWVRIEVESHDERMFFSVTDSGPGIPVAARPRLFQPLFTTKQGRGSGAGLLAVRQIIEAQGGHVLYDDSCPNTRFVIDFPLSGAVVAPENDDPPRAVA